MTIITNIHIHTLAAAFQDLHACLTQHRSGRHSTRVPGTGKAPERLTVVQTIRASVSSPSEEFVWVFRRSAILTRPSGVRTLLDQNLKVEFSMELQRRAVETARDGDDGSGLEFELGLGCPCGKLCAGSIRGLYQGSLSFEEKVIDAVQEGDIVDGAGN